MPTNYDIEKIHCDLDSAKPDSIRILVAQIHSTEEEWKHIDGLTFNRDINAALETIEKMLSHGMRAAVDMVVFPELSVPEKCIENIQIWSELSGATVIAGSHYHKTKSGYIARSPIIISGKIYFTHKIVPAPVEISPIIGQGLNAGNSITVFKNSPVGDFGVLICSDFLDVSLRQKLLSENLDLLFVPAYQNKSEVYHARMNIECEESEEGLYLVYSNMHCSAYGDGCSSVFGQIDKIYLSKLVEQGITDQKYTCKVCQLDRDHSFMIVEVDLNNKKPFMKRTVHTRPNIRIIELRKGEDSASIAFLRKIAHSDERYANIDNLFVEPNEFESIVSKLAEHKIVFIVGDPGIGKTYTSVKLLKQYFKDGYDPVWFTGLEKGERLVQRQALENFRPKDKQIIYFEDPFGRTVFERRDSISQIFGPLTDHLKDLDAYVIITSRKEIFEQFLQESPAPHELKDFTEELNIIKPSYSTNALLEILKRIAVNRCGWFSVAECYDYVCREIIEHQFATPLEIRDFVFTTENVISIETLKERIERRNYESKQSFSIEMKSCTIYTKVLLSIIFLFGKHSQSSLSKWWTNTLKKNDPSLIIGSSSRFIEEIRGQLGYRIEQYGYKGLALRFIHPYYEEAFAVLSARDHVTSDIISSSIQVVANENLKLSVTSALNIFRKYPALSLNLLDSISNKKVDEGLSIESQIGMKYIALFNEVRDKRIIESLIRFSNPFNLAKKINSETDVVALGYALRFAYNYKLKLEEVRLNSEMKINISKKIDWQKLFKTLRSEKVHSKIITPLEWARTMNSHGTITFISNLTFYEITTWFESFAITDQDRFLKVVGHNIKIFLVRTVGGRSSHKISRAERKDIVYQTSPNDRGVVIDQGAFTAIKERYSLLPVGIKYTVGDFDRGDLISIFNENEEKVAAGISNYTVNDTLLIRGQHTKTIEKILGYTHGPAIKEKNIAFPKKELS